MPLTLDMFSVDGEKPHKPPRVMMHVVDAGQSEGAPIICFECPKCGHNIDWIEDDQSWPFDYSIAFTMTEENG